MQHGLSLDICICSATIQKQNPTYLTNADNSYIDIANSYAIAVADIKEPVPYLAMEYLKAHVGWEVCFNNAGLNSKLIDRDGVVFDAYANKLTMYEKRLAETRNQLNKEIILGIADTPAEYGYSVGKIYRA